MALLFICDYCGAKYEAETTQSITGAITYTDKAKRIRISTEKEPCKNCEAIAEKAKADALEKRKEEVQRFKTE